MLISFFQFNSLFENLFCIFIYALLAFVLFYKIRLRKSPSDTDLFYSLNSLRGIFALDILLGHCVRYEKCFLSPLGSFMLVSVGFFFFVSGYSVTRSYYTKNNYIDFFIKHRIIHLLLIIFGSLFITTIIAYISPIRTGFVGFPADPLIFIKTIFVRINWYMWELLILYIIFYIVFKLFRQHRVFLFCVFLTPVCIYMICNDFARCWLASILCFPLGILWYKKRDPYTKILSPKGKFITFVILSVGIILSAINYGALTGLPFEKSEMISAGVNNILCLGCILLLIILLYYFEPGNMILGFFTSIATPLYLFQFIFIAIAESLGLNYKLKIIFVLVMDVSLSCIIHLIKSRVKHIKSKR